MAVKGELQRLIAALEHQETTSSPRLRDLTEDARAGRIAPVVGRDPEIEESLEIPFTVLLLAGIDEAGPNASLVSDLRRLGRVHDTRGRSISAMVVITAPVTRRRQAVGFA